MKICLLISNFNYQGGGQVAINLASGFSDLGFQVTIVAIRCSDDDLKARPDTPFNVVDLNARNPLTGAFLLRKLLSKSSYTLCLSIGGYANLTASLLARFIFSDIKFIGSEHFAKSPLIGDYPKHYLRFLLPVYKLAYRKLNGLVFVSENLRKVFMNANKTWHQSRCVTIFNPVVRSEDVNVSKPEFDFDSNKFKIIVGLGILEKRKRWDLLLKAFAKLNQSIDCKLLLAGTGSLKQDLSELAIELNVADRVDFLGYIKNTTQLLLGADVVALTSDSEAFGMVLAEGLLAGIQVVSTDSFSGPREVLGNGRYGFLAETGNVESIENALRDALLNPLPIELLNEGASRFNVRNISSCYATFIKDVLGSTGYLNERL